MTFWAILLHGICFLLSSAYLESKRTHLERRVVGGSKASVSEWPFMVHLNFHQAKPLWKICGGALIAADAVITAAHCIEDIHNLPDKVTVGVYSPKPSKANESPNDYSVSRIRVHPNFILPENRVPQGNFTYDYDIAILKLERSVGEDIKFVQLPDESSDIYADPSQTCKVAGWGSTAQFRTKDDYFAGKYNISDDLMETELPIIDKTRCVKRDGMSDQFMWGKQLARVICTGELGEKQTSTTCLGDSGSPLVCKKHKKYVGQLQGIVITATERCEAGHSHLYFSQVSKYKKWIDNLLNEV